MTDGTTGFHVAPITEDDMSRVKSILQRAADAIVGMSQLHADVDMLRQTVTSLQADTERLRSQNNALDEALNHSRAVRDEQTAQLAEVDHALIAATNEAIRFEAERDSFEFAFEQYQIDLDLARRAKDDAEFKVLELEDKLAKAMASLERIKAAFDLAPFTQPAPAGDKLAPITDTRPSTVNEWQPGYYWDAHTSKYWRNDLTPPKRDGDAILF